MKDSDGGLQTSDDGEQHAGRGQWRRIAGGGAIYLRKYPPVNNSGGQKGRSDLFDQKGKMIFLISEFLTGGIYVGTLPPAIRRHWQRRCAAGCCHLFLSPTARHCQPAPTVPSPPVITALVGSLLSSPVTTSRPVPSPRPRPRHHPHGTTRVGFVVCREPGRI